MPSPLRTLTLEELARLRQSTLAHYEQNAQAFWQGTKDHDVAQNTDALLAHLEGDDAHDILDLGCGPGRDLMTFRAAGHSAVGLDGSAAFVAMARTHSGCEVWHQDLLALELPERRFDGVFANAVLFHVPSQELPRVLRELRGTLRPGGALFTSNPRGPDVERGDGSRYGCYLTAETWCAYLTEAGFKELDRYYRPAGRPREEQPWLATVWRR